MKRSLKLFAFPPLLFAPLLLTQARAQTSAVTVEEIIKVVGKYPQQIQSARMEGVQTWKMTPDFGRFVAPSSPGEIQARQFSQPAGWAFKGEKRWMHYAEPIDAAAQEKAKVRHKTLSVTRTEIFDGQKRYNVLTEGLSGLKNNVVHVNMGSKGGVSMLPLSSGLHMSNKWLVDALRTGSYQVAGTSSDPQFGLLYQLTGSSDSRRRVRLWLAPKYGFLAVRVEQGNPEVGNHTLTVLKVNRVEQHGSIWFPVAGSMQYLGFENGKQILLSERTYNISRLELNNVPDSLFTVEMKPGYAVRDTDTQKYWKVGLKGEKIYKDLTTNAQQSEMRYGWLFMLSATTLLGLGVNALWRRRRRAAS